MFHVGACELFRDNGPGQQNFTVILDCCRRSILSPSPFSGASVISKQLSLQPMPSPEHNQPIRGQLCAWIWASLLSSSICQYHSIFLPSFLSHSVILSFQLIKFFLPSRPTSVNMHPLAVPKYQFKPPPHLPISLLLPFSKTRLCPTLFLHTSQHFKQAKQFSIR